MLLHRSQILAALVAVTLGACTTFHGNARLENADALGAKSIAGLLSGPSKAPLNLFMVHGMGESHADYWQAILRNAPQASGVTEAATEEAMQAAIKARRPVPFTRNMVIRGEALECGTASDCGAENICGSLNGTRDCVSAVGDLYVLKLNVRGRPVNIYAYRWENTALAVERIYTHPDKTGGGAPANRWLKNGLMIDGFSDAATILGDYGDVIRDGTEAALCMMIADIVEMREEASGAKPCYLNQFGDMEKKIVREQDFAFITHSLGSRILFDALSPRAQIDDLEDATYALTSDQRNALRALPPGCPTAGSQALKDVTDAQTSLASDGMAKSAIDAIRMKNEVAARTTSFFMLANQMPLLGLGAIQARRADQMKLRDAIYRLYVDPGASSAGLAPGAIEAWDTTSKQAAASLDQVCNPGDPMSYLACLSNASARSDQCSGIKPTVTPIQFTAFRDPSDFLGFKGSQHAVGTASRIMSPQEITHTNANIYLFFVAAPWAAHDQEDKRPQSQRIIWCGARVEANGRLADSCPGVAK